jgi:hypothetical protein
VTQETVFPLPQRMETPGGNPLAVQVKGAVPPEPNHTVRVNGQPRVTSSKLTLMEGSAGGTPMTSMAMRFT